MTIFASINCQIKKKLYLRQQLYEMTFERIKLISMQTQLSIYQNLKKLI